MKFMMFEVAMDSNPQRDVGCSDSCTHDFDCFV